MKALFLSPIILFVITTIPKTSYSAEAYGLIMVAKGQVQLQRKNSSQNEPAKVGSKVFPGDTIKTSLDSRAKIVMSDRNVLNLAPDTILVIAKYTNNEDQGKSEKNAELLMLKGKVRAKVEEKYNKDNQGFQIKTPTAVAGVRGTEFFVNYNPQTRSTDVFVTGGVVNVAPLISNSNSGNTTSTPTAQSLEQSVPDTKNEVPVEKNQTSSVSQNAAPTPPRAFSPQEMNSIKTDIQETKSEAKESTKTQENKTETKTETNADSKNSGDKNTAEGSETKGQTPAAEKTETKKEMIKRDMVGSGAVTNDSQLNKEIKAPPTGAPSPIGSMPTTVLPPPLPPPPPSNVSDIIQNQNKNSNVTIQPTK